MSDHPLPGIPAEKVPGKIDGSVKPGLHGMPPFTTPFAPGLLALLLTACATPTPRAAPLGAGTKSSTTATSGDGSVLVCDDYASTGSNIRRRHCYRETEEMRRARQQQIDALHQSAPVNAAKSSGPQ